MTACNVKRFRDCMIVLLMLGIVGGMAGCLKKALKTSSPDGFVSGETTSELGTGGQPGETAVGGTSGPMMEAFREGGSHGLVVEDGEISEGAVEILGDDLGSGAGDSGNLLALVEPGERGLPEGSMRGDESFATQDAVFFVEDPVAPASEATKGSGLGVHGKGASGESGEVEHVTEPLIFAKVQPESMASLPASAVGSEASATTDTFFIKEGFENIYFDFDRWAIPTPMVERLAAHASWLKAHPDSKVLIEGHCDISGSREYNVVLGEKRARSVQDFLLDLGVKENQLSLVSYGKERLTCFEEVEGCQKNNRRAHLVLK